MLAVEVCSETQRFPAGSCWHTCECNKAHIYSTLESMLSSPAPTFPKKKNPQPQKTKKKTQQTLRWRVPPSLLCGQAEALSEYSDKKASESAEQISVAHFLEKKKKVLLQSGLNFGQDIKLYDSWDVCSEAELGLNWDSV